MAIAVLPFPSHPLLSLTDDDKSRKRKLERDGGVTIVTGKRRGERDGDRNGERI